MWHKIVFIGLLLLCSCASQKRALNLHRDEIALGVDSLEIFKKYGPATQMWHEGEGNVYSYSYAKPKYDFVFFLPWPLFRSRFDNYEVVLAFDGDGKLVDIKRFYGDVVVKSWLICEFGEGDCEVARGQE